MASMLTATGWGANRSASPGSVPTGRSAALRSPSSVGGPTGCWPGTPFADKRPIIAPRGSCEDEFWDRERQAYVREPLPLLGAGATLGEPDISNGRARFWFTERGWDRFGRALASEGRRRGHVIQVIRRKNPHPSQIVYADAWQMALLPLKTQARRR